MPGGRGRGRGGRGRGNEDRETQVSKKMSLVLRHKADQEGLKLDKSGYANCAELLNWQVLRSMKVTFSELRQVVEDSSKKRFELIPVDPNDPLSDPEDPAQFMIRASQGHSLTLASEDIYTALDPASPECPAMVVHGTNPSAWTSIQKSGGLSRMGRGHVHFAVGMVGEKVKPEEKVLPEPAAGDDKSIEGASAQEANAEAGAKDDEVVISGMRASATILIWVDVKRSATEGGLKWWRSANGVVLTEGDEKGFVKMDWFDRVEERGKGQKRSRRKVIWQREES